MDPWKAYLLAGLILHKGVWEILKRRLSRPLAQKPQDFVATAAKIAKFIVLGGMIAQTFLPDLFPLSDEPEWWVRPSLLRIPMGT